MTTYIQYQSMLSSNYLPGFSIQYSWICEMLPWMKIKSNDQFNFHYVLIFISWISPPSQTLYILVGIFLLQMTDLPLKLE